MTIDEVTKDYVPSPELIKIFNQKAYVGKIKVNYEPDPEDENEAGIPILSVSGKSLAEAWENSLIALAVKGGRVPTEYDKNDASRNDPNSLDCTMHTIITSPLSEPYIHRAFPGGLEDLEEYRQEVLDGIKDHWVRDPNDPKDERWEYTYHQRMFKYEVPGLEEAINQFETMAQKLAKSPNTRRAQIISWQPWMDNKVYDPACFQSLWGRCYKNKAGVLCLNINMRFRSRDAYDAAYMNDFAFILLGEKLANRISELRKEPVILARFEDTSDSYHIYGRRLQHFDENFLGQLLSRSFEERTWTREFAEEIFAEARPMIKAKVDAVDSQRPPKPRA